MTRPAQPSGTSVRRDFSATITVAIVALTLVGCGRKGSGTSAQEAREIGAFTAVALKGGAKLTLHVDPAGEPGPVQVSGDDDVVPAVTTRLVGSTLHIETPDAPRPNLPLEVSATVRSLHSVEVAGAADLTVVGVRGPSFELEVSGAADARLQGTVGRLDVEVNGAASVRAAELIAQEVDLEMNGAGDARVHAAKSLKAEVNGAGSVRYSGKPSDVRREVSGVGSVQAVGD